MNCVCLIVIQIIRWIIGVNGVLNVYSCLMNTKPQCRATHAQESFITELNIRTFRLVFSPLLLKPTHLQLIRVVGLILRISFYRRLTLANALSSMSHSLSLLVTALKIVCTLRFLQTWGKSCIIIHRPQMWVCVYEWVGVCAWRRKHTLTKWTYFSVSKSLAAWKNEQLLSKPDVRHNAEGKNEMTE